MIRTFLSLTLLAAGSSLVAAQSNTATNFTAAPMTTAPASKNTLPTRIETKIRPAARSGESGLRVGEGAATGEPIEVRRMK